MQTLPPTAPTGSDMGCPILDMVESLDHVTPATAAISPAESNESHLGGDAHAYDVEMEEALKMIPMRRAGEAEEVAATVAFLCSKDAGYITRQTIAVNGGMF